MFGVFQADLPIGKTLWKILLIVIVSGNSESIYLYLLNEDSIPSLSHLFLFVGQVLINSVFLGLLMSVPILIIQYYRDKKLEQVSPFTTTVKSKNENTVEVVLNFALIVSTIIAADNFGSPSMTHWGTIGLGLYTLFYVFEFENSLFKDVHELLEIGYVDGTLVATLTSYLFTENFEIDSSLNQEIRFLVDNGWDMTNPCHP